MPMPMFEKLAHALFGYARMPEQIIHQDCENVDDHTATLLEAVHALGPRRIKSLAEFIIAHEREIEEW